MPQVERNGCRLSYRVDGNPEGDTLLFSNSLGTTGALWQPQLDALSPLFRLIRYDTRGHGASDAPRGAYTIDDLGLDALAILDAAGATAAHICGLSLGGLTGMWLGVHARNRVRSLVLSNTAARIGSARIWQERIELVKTSGVAPLADASMGRWFTDSFRAAHPDVVARYHQMLVSCPADGYASCCAALRDADLRTAIGKIAAPTLVIAGTHDPVTPPADADVIRARIRGARVFVLDAAHLSNVEQADAFNESVIAFITQHEEGRRDG